MNVEEARIILKQELHYAQLKRALEGMGIALEAIRNVKGFQLDSQLKPLAQELYDKHAILQQTWEVYVEEHKKAKAVFRDHGLRTMIVPDPDMNLMLVCAVCGFHFRGLLGTAKRCPNCGVLSDVESMYTKEFIEKLKGTNATE